MAKTLGDKSSMFERFIPVVLVVTIGLAFLVGMLWQKVANLEGGGSGTANNVLAPSDNGAQPQVNGKLTEDQVKKLSPVSDDDHIEGSKDADIVMIEYSDLECPFCERFHPTGKQALEEYGDKIAWVFRHFPLETLHPRAYPAAIALECVSDQAGNSGVSKFIDTVFSDQQKYLTDSGLRQAAVGSGANGDTFDKCFESKDVESKIREVASKGSEAGVTGTPATFVVNKKGEAWLVPGAVPYESLKATIEEALGN